MYNHIKSCRGVDGRLSNYFLDNIGLMQCEVLSPILFNLFVNDFEFEFLNSGCTPYKMSSMNLFLLMYADDMVLFSKSVEGLQVLFNELVSYCYKWKLCVYVDKSNIFIFRSSGKIRSNEKWHIGDEVLKTVEQFTF